MRESLTIFAIALIALLSALLVGPYLVDWNKQRDWLAAKLSETMGAEVRIGGSVDVKLLPRPLFRATQVSIAGASPQDPSVTAAGLDAELSINSLLQGAVEFVDATVLEPHLNLTTRDDGTLVAGAWDVTNPQRFMFRHIRVRDGAVVVRDPAGHERGSISGFDAEGEAETLFGPLRLSGRATAQNGAFRFRLATGAYTGRRLRVKLVADDLKPFAHADLDGTLALSPAPDRKGAALSFAGNLAASGLLHVADGFAPVPWQVAAGDLKADGKGVSSTGVELRAGADARALVANGAVLVDFGAVPSAVVQLKARQLDLDRIAVPPDIAPDTRRPGAAQWLAALQGFAAGQTAPPGRLKLDWNVDAITSGDLTLTDAAGTLDLAAGAPVRGRFAVAGPDGFRVALDGAVERGAGAVFRGHVEAATHNLPASVAWLAPLAPDAADWALRHAAVSDVAFAGTVDLSATGAAARDATLTVDGSTLSGAAALTRGVGNDPPRLFADIRADTIDTGRLPALADLTGLTDPLDLSVGVAARALKLARAGFGTIETGALALHLTKAGTAVTLDSFALSGLDGASVSATGTLAADRTVKLQGKVTAADAAPLAALVHQVLPGPATEALTGRAALLSPLGLDIALNGSLNGDGQLVPALATLKGTAAATRVSATITPEPARLFAAQALNLLAVLDAPDGAALLRQLGLESAGPASLGPSHVELTARGTAETGYDTHLAATAGDVTLAFDGRSDGATGQGHGKASGRNAGPFLKALALALPPATAAWPWDVAADLDWSGAAVRADKLTGHLAGTAVSGTLARAAESGELSGSVTLDALDFGTLAALVLGPAPAGPAAPGRLLTGADFAPAPTGLPPAQLQVQVGRLDLRPGLALAHAGFNLRLTPGILTLGALSGSVAGGKAGGTLTLRRNGPSASLSGQVQLDGVAVALPSLAGKLSGSLSLAGSGTSPDALAASLAGDGALTFAGTLPHFDPQALGTTAKAYEAEDASIDAEAIRTALGTALDSTGLDLGTVVAPVTVAAGTLRTGALRSQVAAGTLTSEATLDLRGLQFTLRATLTAAELPKDWKGDPPAVTVTWRGPLATPAREVDVGAFVNGLAARAIAREQDRIQLMQDDLRERAFFARRLKHMEEERADKAAAAAREAAAARDAAEKAKAAAAPTLSGRPAPNDPVARLLNTLPAPPPVPPTRPADRGQSPAGGRATVPGSAPDADLIEKGLY